MVRIDPRRSTAAPLGLLPAVQVTVACKVTHRNASTATEQCCHPGRSTPNARTDSTEQLGARAAYGTSTGTEPNPELRAVPGCCGRSCCHWLRRYAERAAECDARKLLDPAAASHDWNAKRRCPRNPLKM
ncbi:rapamycin-insensitive companion of mtor [Anopheles sinensis]|uniref:Rapamycin-insensitive companion of mtor n=1 Tax=Anopheles sinensis TaxID=74873 RepID=A0A084VQP8_ANOSI|nr:rapamycin-insensitive companion of mtor [Anopheles sinensis]